MNMMTPAAAVYSCVVIAASHQQGAPAAPTGDAQRVSLSRWGQLTDSSQSQGDDGLEPPYSVVPWELSRFWLWSIREGKQGRLRVYNAE